MAMKNPKAGCGYVHAIGAGCCLALTVAGYLLVAKPVIRTQLDQASLRAEKVKLFANVSGRNLLKDDDTELSGLTIRDRRFYLTVGAQY